MNPEDLEILQTYIAETRELLDEAELGLLDLQRSTAAPNALEIVHALFRVFHSIKGAAATLGFSLTAKLTHAAENLLAVFRKGESSLDPNSIDRLLSVVDLSRKLTDINEKGQPEGALESSVVALCSELANALTKPRKSPSSPAKGAGRSKPAKSRRASSPAPGSPSAAEGAAASGAAAAGAGGATAAGGGGAAPDAAGSGARAATPATAEEEVRAPSSPTQETPAQPALAEGQAAVAEARDIENGAPAASAERPENGAPPGAGSAKSLDQGEFVQTFQQESQDLLGQLESALLNAETQPDAKEPIQVAFRAIHSFKGNCGFMGYAPLERLAHRAENLLEVLKTSPPNRVAEGTRSCLPVVDVLRNALGELANGGTCSEEPFLAVQEQLERALATARGEEPPKASPTPAENAPPPAPAPVPPAGAGEAQRQDVRVDLRKLDAMVNLASELVIAESMVLDHPIVAGADDERLARAVHMLRRVSVDLQNLAMALRMVPVSTAFRKLVRVVHDVSQRVGKRIRLELIGEETEVDKSVLEMLSDPLVHLVRNSIDHGFETPTERAAANKSEEGLLTVEARHAGSEVLIMVRDDGRGLHRAKILKKAIERGLVHGNGDGLADEQVFALIFEPGFSTATEVTDISGRGVGMDVVRSNIAKIKGRVELRSTPGQETAVILHVPLTVAIIDGMLVRVGTARYTLPLLAIREALRATSDQIIVTPEGSEIVRIRDELLPVVRLHQVFGRQPDSTQLEDGILIVTEAQGRTTCLFADEILGQQQAVIKALSSYLGQARGISGCTILGDGEVSLILDVGQLVGSPNSTAGDFPS